jgi:hypothetical protein
MKTGNHEIKTPLDTMEVSADIDGFRLWFRAPNTYQVSRSGAPFLAAALLPAMLKGEELEIDPGMPESPRLLDHVSQLREIHHCWNPVLKIAIGRIDVETEHVITIVS